MYQEFAAPTDGVVCSWERRPELVEDALIVPDGCLDIVGYADGRVLVAGPDTRPWRSGVERPMVGVRLAPGRARGLIGRPLSELRDLRVPIDELGPTSLGDALAPALADAPQEERRALLVATIRDRLGGPDALVAAAIERLERQPRMRVAELADELGVSARHLQRRFVDRVGYGPKMFARVARLQRFVTRGSTAALVDIAYDTGYASQSHLTDEVRELTGLTPVRFLEERGRRAA